MEEDWTFDDPRYWREVLGGGSIADGLLLDDALRKAVQTGSPHRVHSVLVKMARRTRDRAEREAIDLALRDRRAFATQASSSPGLGRLNGVGLGMYGRADVDPDDGTYVKTRFVSFLWLPVIPIDSWLVQDADKGWYFLAGVPLSRRLRLWQLADVVLAIAAFALVTFGRMHDATHTDFHVVNGLDLPVVVNIDGQRLEVPSQGRSEVELGIGAVDLVCRDHDGNEIEVLHETLDAKHEAVIYNVVGVAPLYVETVPYGSSREDTDRYASLHWYIDRSWIPLLRLDCPFEAPPATVNVKAGRVETRRVSAVVEGGWRSAAWIVWEEESAARAAALAARVVCVSGDTDGVIESAYDTVVAMRAPVAAELAIDSWIRQHGTSEHIDAFRLLLQQPLPPLTPESMILATRERHEWIDWMREEYSRTAQRPVTSMTDDPSELSRFGGRPWLRSGESWPACGRCAASMPLVVQLDLESLPTSTRLAGRTGVLQAFVCARGCCGDAQIGPALADDSKLARVIARDGSGGIAAEDLSPEGWASLPIIRWAESDDLPSVAELDRLFRENAWKARMTYEDPEIVTSPPNVAGDKLGGWPTWTDGVAYPSCRECGNAMDAVFQLGSHQHVPFAWGGDASATAHVCACATHGDVVALVWGSR